MKFTKIEKIELNKRNYGDLQSFILEFEEAHIKYAIVEEYKHKSITSVQSALNKTAKRLNRYHIQCITRNGKVYLKNNAIKEE